MHSSISVGKMEREVMPIEDCRVSLHRSKERQPKIIHLLTMAVFATLANSKSRPILIGILVLYVILCIVVLILGGTVQVSAAHRSNPNAKFFTLAKAFRLLGGLPAISLGTFAVIALSLKKSPRGLLYIFLLGIPSSLFQGIGALLDASCSASFSNLVEQRHALLAAAALGIFVTFASVAVTVFLGLNRRSMAAMAGGQAPSTSSAGFEPYYDEPDSPLDDITHEEDVSLDADNRTPEH